MSSHTAARAERPGVAHYLSLVIGAFATDLVRRRTLARLDDLDDHLLRDIGLTRGDLDSLRRHR